MTSVPVGQDYVHGMFAGVANKTYNCWLKGSPQLIYGIYWKLRIQSTSRGVAARSSLNLSRPAAADTLRILVKRSMSSVPSHSWPIVASFWQALLAKRMFTAMVGKDCEKYRTCDSLPSPSTAFTPTQPSPRVQ